MRKFLFIILFAIGLWISVIIAREFIDPIFKDIYMNIGMRFLTGYIMARILIWIFADYILENFYE